MWTSMRRLIALFALILLGIPANASVASPECPKDAQNPPRPSSHQDYGSYQGWIIGGSSSPKTPEPKPPGVEQNSPQPSEEERMLVLFTGIIALTTLVYAIFAGLQWREMKRMA